MSVGIVWLPITTWTGDARVVSGVNLPMLLRVLNYSAQSLQQFCESAVCGGTNGIKKDRE